MKCFFHNDMDGRCAAAIVVKYYESESKVALVGDSLECIPAVYGDPFPFDRIREDENVIIVDFSLEEPGDWEKLIDLCGHERVIWIDHHKTSLEKSAFPELQGLRKDGVAACELAWEYFFSETSAGRSGMPEVVKLIGDRDVWKFQYGDRTKKNHAGLLSRDTSPDSLLWNTLMDDDKYDTKAALADVIQEGIIIKKYQTQNYKELIDGISFYAEFEGYKAICCNSAFTASTLFDSISDSTYEIMLTFYASENGWTISLYTKKTEIIDVSEIAAKYGGGGHTGAAGFTCKQLWFSDGKVVVGERNV